MTAKKIVIKKPSISTSSSDTREISKCGPAGTLLKQEKPHCFDTEDLI